MSKLGVVGTMVWDTIYGRDAGTMPADEWGGIAYALAALETTLAESWEIVPLIKVGRDMAPAANEFLHSLTRRSAAARFIEVPQPNNRVLLHYDSLQRRTERLTGGVPPWQWSELEPLIRDLDAVYVNFISGFELDLPAARRMRGVFSGPIYADLHSLLLGITRHGDRFPQRLVDPEGWFACFDVVQLNEEELGLIGADPMAVAATAIAVGVKLLVVTLGAGGAVYFTTRPFSLHSRAPQGTGPIETARLAVDPVLDEGDTTGCGDVFGATLLARLLEEVDIPDAIRDANVMAVRNVAHRGATNLHYHLRGQIAPR